MKITVETGIRDFNTWSGATITKSTIIEHDKESEFDSLIEELYPDGLTDVGLNDLLWHDSEWVLESLGIDEEE